MKNYVTAYSLFLFLTSCSSYDSYRNQASKPTPRSPSTELSATTSFNKLIQIRENSGAQIKIGLGEISKTLQLSSAHFNYEVRFKGIHDEKAMTSTQIEDPVIQSGEITDLSGLTIPTLKTGVYMVYLFNKKDKPFWIQKIFSVAAAEKNLTESEKNELAQKYAPIANYPQNELYYPVSLEYLTNQIEPDSALNEEPFLLTNRTVSETFFSTLFKSKNNTLNVSFKFKDILQVLPYYGHHESVLKSGLKSSADSLLKKRYGKNNATVYYSIFENTKWNEILINYHFFYSYDPKNGTANKDVMPAHIFDRESMTVVLRASTKQPLYVYYGAHLPNQTMAQLDSTNSTIKQSWKTGRTFVNWSNAVQPLQSALKFDTHPIAAMALGSHAIYPKPDLYAVLIGRIKALVEPAGGTRYLIPNTIKNFNQAQYETYQLKKLNLENVISGSQPENILAYSGSTVDVLGPVNASFPPFTDREENFMAYADPNAPLFDMQK